MKSDEKLIYLILKNNNPEYFIKIIYKEIRD